MIKTNFRLDFKSILNNKFYLIQKILITIIFIIHIIILKMFPLKSNNNYCIFKKYFELVKNYIIKLII